MIFRLFGVTFDFRTPLLMVYIFWGVITCFSPLMMPRNPTGWEIILLIANGVLFMATRDSIGNKLERMIDDE